MRGRSRNKGPNPLTRSYESNGPDVKIRGTAQHVADKYAQLARDAQASGDPVAAENYFQHAEHYYRLIAAAQEQFRQQYPGAQRDEDGEEGDEDGMGFAGPNGQGDEFGEGFPQGQGYPQGQAYLPQVGQNYPQNQGYEPRGDRGDRQNQQPRYDRNDRNDRQNQNRQRFDRNGGERNDRNFDRGEPRYDRQGGQGGERQAGERQPGAYERPNGGGERFDRQNGYDRQQQNGRDDRQRYGRDERPRDDRPRDERPRDERPRDERPREERAPRGEGYAPRENRRPAYGAEMPAEDDRDLGANLPAFLTNPVRPAISVDEVAETTGLANQPPAAEGETGIRPRRRRTRKAETDAVNESADQAAEGA